MKRLLFHVEFDYPTSFKDDYGHSHGYVYAGTLEEVEQVVRSRFTSKARVTDMSIVQEPRLFYDN